MAYGRYFEEFNRGKKSLTLDLKRPATRPTCTTYTGWMSVTGEPDGPPGKCGVSVVDFAGGPASMAALPAGLWDAQRTGVGRDIDISLLDTAVSMPSYFAIWALNRDWQAERVADSGHQSLVPPPELSHARRLDRRLLQQGEVLAEPGGRARPARRCYLALACYLSLHGWGCGPQPRRGVTRAQGALSTRFSNAAEPL